MNRFEIKKIYYEGIGTMFFFICLFFCRVKFNEIFQHKKWY